MPVAVVRSMGSQRPRTRGTHIPPGRRGGKQPPRRSFRQSGTRCLWRRTGSAGTARGGLRPSRNRQRRHEAGGRAPPARLPVTLLRLLPCLAAALWTGGGVRGGLGRLILLHRSVEAVLPLVGLLNPFTGCRAVAVGFVRGRIRAGTGGGGSKNTHNGDALEHMPERYRHPEFLPLSTTGSRSGPNAIGIARSLPACCCCDCRTCDFS